MPARSRGHRQRNQRGKAPPCLVRQVQLPKRTLFNCTTNKPLKELQEQLQSRCKVLYFDPIPATSIAKLLMEQFRVTLDVTTAYAKGAGGNVRTARVRSLPVFLRAALQLKPPVQELHQPGVPEYRNYLALIFLRWKEFHRHYSWTVASSFSRMARIADTATRTTHGCRRSPSAKPPSSRTASAGLPSFSQYSAAFTRNASPSFRLPVGLSITPAVSCCCNVARDLHSDWAAEAPRLPPAQPRAKGSMPSDYALPLALA